MTVLYEVLFEEFSALFTSYFVVKKRPFLSNKAHFDDHGVKCQ